MEENEKQEMDQGADSIEDSPVVEEVDENGSSSLNQDEISRILAEMREADEDEEASEATEDPGPGKEADEPDTDDSKPGPKDQEDPGIVEGVGPEPGKGAVDADEPDVDDSKAAPADKEEPGTGDGAGDTEAETESPPVSLDPEPEDDKPAGAGPGEEAGDMPETAAGDAGEVSVSADEEKDSKSGDPESEPEDPVLEKEDADREDLEDNDAESPEPGRAEKDEKNGPGRQVDPDTEESPAPEAGQENGDDPASGHPESEPESGAEDDEPMVSEVPGGEASVLHEVQKPGKQKKFLQMAAGILCLVIMCAMIWFGLKTQARQSDIEDPGTEDQMIQVLEETGARKPLAENEEAPVLKNQTVRTLDPMDKKLEEVSRLREELLIKEGEVAELKHHYHFTIETVREKIFEEKNRLGIKTFDQAIQNKGIELQLNTIQRRLAYVQGLERPETWLDHGSEELLYTRRKFEIDRTISRVAGKPDLEGMIKECDAQMAKYRLSADKLSIQMNQTEPLKKIWRQILEQEKTMVLNKLTPRNGSSKNNKSNDQDRLIWEEICQGNLTRKAALTALSVEAAKCLSRSKEKDLFLNHVSDLHAASARHLFKWKGAWICLNGLERLPPETARHLFQWKGQWISMNRLPDISFDSLMHLAKWKGNKLELMGLKADIMKNDPLALKFLLEWEKKGGKLYISDEFRGFIKMSQRI